MNGYTLGKPILAKDLDFICEELAQIKNAKNNLKGQPGARLGDAATLLIAIRDKAPPI